MTRNGRSVATDDRPREWVARGEEVAPEEEDLVGAERVVVLRPAGALLLSLALLGVVVGGVVDLILDAPGSWVSVHVVVETGLIGLSLGLSLYLWRGWLRTSRSLERTREALEVRAEERDRWRRSARKVLEGLGEAIDEQFEAWGLTPAEKEVALLLVKGHSHRRIARLTDRGERTARQHASSVYAKAGLSGRAELAAFFLEDLMLPAERGVEAVEGGEEPA